MASIWHKAMVYLGLGPDDEYEGYSTANERGPAQATSAAPHREQSHGAPRQASAPRPAGQQRPRAPQGETDRRPSQRPAGSQRSAPQAQRPAGTQRTPERPPPPPTGRDEASAVRPVPAPGKPEGAATKQRTVVRPVPASSTSKPYVVAPTSFNSAQDVADKFKGGQPVVLNLQSVDRDLARRLIDFASGLCYGLGGHMEKVAHQAYLLTPENVEVSPEDRRRLSSRS